MEPSSQPLHIQDPQAFSAWSNALTNDGSLSLKEKFAIFFGKKAYIPNFEHNCLEHRKLTWTETFQGAAAPSKVASLFTKNNTCRPELQKVLQEASYAEKSKERNNLLRSAINEDSFQALAELEPSPLEIRQLCSELYSDSAKNQFLRKVIECPNLEFQKLVFDQFSDFSFVAEEREEGEPTLLNQAIDLAKAEPNGGYRTEFLQYIFKSPRFQVTAEVLATKPEIKQVGGKAEKAYLKKKNVLINTELSKCGRLGKKAVKQELGILTDDEKKELFQIALRKKCNAVCIEIAKGYTPKDLVVFLTSIKIPEEISIQVPNLERAFTGIGPETISVPCPHIVYKFIENEIKNSDQQLLREFKSNQTAIRPERGLPFIFGAIFGRRGR